MVALVDTNILVYRFDPRDLRKQKIATEVLRLGLKDGSLRVAHQSVIEFFAAVTRPLRDFGPLLSPTEATREAEELLIQFEVIYPNEESVRAGLRATSAYQLSWFDALIWACADTNGLGEIISEDFQHGRHYGRVRVVNPFQ